MYRDVAQWAKIRHRILVEGVSQRQVVRETGISRVTIRKMLAHSHPQSYGPRSRRYPKLGPHTASVQRMLRENGTLPPPARLSVRAMYEHIRDQEGFRGSYGAVKDYVRPLPSDDSCIWEYAYDLLVSLDKKRAIDFLFCLSRADPPVISPARAEPRVDHAAAGLRCLGYSRPADRQSRSGPSGRGSVAVPPDRHARPGRLRAGHGL